MPGYNALEITDQHMTEGGRNARPYANIRERKKDQSKLLSFDTSLSRPHITKSGQMHDTCVDTDNFDSGGPVLERIQIPLLIGDHHRPASETPFKWR